MMLNTQNCYTWFFSDDYFENDVGLSGSSKHQEGRWVGFSCQLKLPSQEGGGAYRDVGEGRAHHEVEDPGLQLDDVGGRELRPNCGQYEEEDRREEGEEGLVQAVVFQRVAAIRSAKQKRGRQLRALRQQTRTARCGAGGRLTSERCRDSWAASQWRSRLKYKNKRL